MIIGIDLGTTNSCVGVWKDGRVEIIANDLGNRTTPSYVSFTDKEILVGETAVNSKIMNIHRTIYDAKRLIGRNFDDKTVSDDMNTWSFKVINKNNKPYIQIENNDIEKDYLSKELNNTKDYLPEEISAFILKKMKATAEAYLGQEVKKAVITVPAYFNDAQRTSTKDAGTIAGLEVVRIINEPTAAALAYGFDAEFKKAKNILIYDYGGGTLDVSLLNIDKDVDGELYKVIATAGNCHMGGSDLDSCLTKYLMEEFKRKHKKDLTGNHKAIGRLRNAAERAKKALSNATQTSIEIDALYEGIDFTMTITRARFEELCGEIFNKIMEPVDQVMRDSKLDKYSIDEIIIVGGSTRIPKIQRMLSEYFDGKELSKKINPDEAIAYGAAIQGAILSGIKDKNNKINNTLIIDVLPLSLGVKTGENMMTPIVDRNTTIPTRKSKIFSTSSNNQTTIDIRIAQGERPIFSDNMLLGSFKLDGIKPARRGEPQIEIIFDIDSNGIINVSAEEIGGVQKKLTITHDMNRLSKDDIEKIIEEAKMNEEKDNEYKKNTEAKNKLENYIYALREKEDLSEEKKKQIDEIATWLNDNQNETANIYEEKYKNLEL